eukprot:67164_1
MGCCQLQAKTKIDANDHTDGEESHNNRQHKTNPEGLEQTVPLTEINIEEISEEKTIHDEGNETLLPIPPDRSPRRNNNEDKQFVTDDHEENSNRSVNDMQRMISHMDDTQSESNLSDDEDITMETHHASTFVLISTRPDEHSMVDVVTRHASIFVLLKPRPGEHSMIDVVPVMHHTSIFVLVTLRPDEQKQRKKSNRHAWRTGLNFDAMNHQIVFNISDAATNETYTARLGRDELNREVTINEYNKMGEVMGTGHRKYMETDDGHCKVTLSKGDIVYEFIAQCNS